jgi:hypothetical protein
MINSYFYYKWKKSCDHGDYPVTKPYSLSCDSKDIELKYAKLHMTNVSSLCMIKQI